MSPFVPPDRFVIHETEHWWVNHRCDTSYPGYLMIGAKDPNGESLSDLSEAAQAQLGPLLARSGQLLQECLGAVRVYDGRYGHQSGQTVHYHVIPVYEWTIAAYWQDERYRSLAQFYGDGGATAPTDFDGADMTLFIWRTFCERGMKPPRIDAPSAETVAELLGAKFVLRSEDPGVGRKGCR
jgi:diadenosine tetraphosphate (Ap4A) HIT family hydrolase